MNLDHLLECWRLEVSNKKKPGRPISLLFNVLRRARKDNKLRFLFAYRLAQYLDARGGLARRHARRLPIEQFCRMKKLRPMLTYRVITTPGRCAMRRLTW